MRTATNNGVTLQYPDEIGFCFNPCLFVLNGQNIASVAFSLSDGVITQAAEFDALAGKVYGDIREFVQTLFDDTTFGDIDYTAQSTKSQLGKLVTIHVTAYQQNEEGEKISAAEFEFTVFYIWGALALGETYNGRREVTLFRGFPFTVGLYNDGAEGAVLVGNDGVATTLINLDGQGVFDVTIPNEKARHFYIISDFKGTLAETTFDNTYDLTFRKIGTGTFTEKVRVNIVDGVDEGFYLRWIDRHGFYCYWLFKKGAEQFQIANGGEYVRNNLLAYDQSYGYQGGAGRRQAYTRQDTVPVCAPLVDRDTWDFLLDIATSPVVDLFRGYKADKKTPVWQSVTVQAGTYTKAMRTPLQDFALNILLPEVPTQTL